MARKSKDFPGLFQGGNCPGHQAPARWAPSPVFPWLLGTGGCTRPPWKSRPAGPTRECYFLSCPPPALKRVEQLWGIKELGLLEFKETLPAGGPGAAHSGFSCPDPGGTPRACTPKPLPTPPPPGGDWPPSPGENPGAALRHLTLVCRGIRDPGGGRDPKDRKGKR